MPARTLEVLASHPNSTLWKYTEHTRAKHRLLVGYLHASVSSLAPIGLASLRSEKPDLRWIPV